MKLGSTAFQTPYISPSSSYSDDFFEKPPYIGKKEIGDMVDTAGTKENLSTLVENTEQAYAPKGFSPLKIMKQDRKFQLLQSWEGRVEEIKGEDFIATLLDKTDPTNPEEGVELSLHEVSEEDQNLVRPGAVFYWSIGYEDSPGFPRQRISKIRFRRLPGWTKQEVKTAEEKANEYSSLFE